MAAGAFSVIGILASLDAWGAPIASPPRSKTAEVSHPFTLTPTATIPVLAARSGGGAVDVSSVDEHGVVHRSFNRDGVPSNGLIWRTDEGLLLVDTAWTDEQTEAILKWGERRFGKPWIGAVITHEHADRDGGLPALVRRRIPVAALDLTVAKLAQRGVRGVAVLFAAKDGGVRDPRGFEAFYPGPGHAPDNIVVSFPEVLFGGCLIKSTEARDLGFTGDADLAGWPAAVRRVSEKYHVTTVVPGHGAVDRTGASLRHTLDLLATGGKR